MRSYFSPAMLRTVIFSVWARPPPSAISTAPLGRLRHRVGRALPPPGDRFLTGVTVVLEADEFALPVVQPQAIVHAERPRRILRRSTLGVDRVGDVLDVVLGVGDLAREDARFAGLGVVLLPLRRREHVAAVRAGGISGGDHGLALRAFLRRRLARAVAGRLPDADLVHRPVPQHVAAEVEHQAVLLARVQAETTTAVAHDRHLAITASDERSRVAR